MASKKVAQRIADLIRERKQNGENAVPGFATGATPVGVYTGLVGLHKEEGLSFRNVITFNPDEYYPMKPDSVQSYVAFEQLFDHVDIKSVFILPMAPYGKRLFRLSAWTMKGKSAEWEAWTFRI